MKIIQDARKAPKKSCQVICGNCASVLEVTVDDTIGPAHHCQRDGSWYDVPCGVCKHTIMVDYDKLGKKFSG